MAVTGRIVSPRLSVLASLAASVLVAACSGSNGTGSLGGDAGSGSSSGGSSGGGSGSSSGGSSGGSSGSSSGGSSGSSSGSSSGGSSGSSSGGTSYETVTINFDELPGNTKVTTQYAPHATFSCGSPASGNNFNSAFDPGDLGQSLPNFICSDDEECDTDYVVVFGAPVDGLAFDAIGVNDMGTVATLVIHQGSTVTSIPFVGKGNDLVAVHVDLSPYPGVTEVDVTKITDPAGFGLDTFVFQYPN
jgi:hypothetical protein